MGTVITVDQLGRLSTTSKTITGAVGGTGNLTITQDTTITMADSLIEFGAGTVNAASSYALLQSNNSAAFQGSWSAVDDQMTIVNDGNVGTNITVQSNRKSGKSSPFSFICTGDIGECGSGIVTTSIPGGALSFAFMGSNNEGSSCGGTLASSFTEFVAANIDYNLCS